MALRTFIRLLALALATVPLSCLLWDLAGPLPALVGLGLVGFVLLYLLLLAGEGDLTRWQLRYHLTPGDDTDRLEELLHFLADRTGQFVVETSGQGLFMELPAAFDRYVEGQLSRALPELKLSREDGQGSSRPGSFFLGVGAPSSETLRWATEEESRQVRWHIHQGPHATLVARTDGEVPPGRWLRLPRLLGKLWHRLPVWDDLSDGVRLSSLLPHSDEGAVYSSRSRLLHLAPPDGYAPDSAAGGGCRVLGQSSDGRSLTLSHDVPLFTVGAPSSFLVRQALDDLAAGRCVVVISPHRRVLERIEHRAGGSPIYWLDPQNSRKSIHLAIVSATEWATVKTETVTRVTRTFLADRGLDVDLPVVGDFTHRLLHALAGLARQTGQDLTFTDLYAVSQNTQALRAFLTGTPGEAARGLLAQLDDDVGYVQAVTILSAIRSALKPLGTGSLHVLCRAPFLNFGHLLEQKALLLVPMTDADFPEHDRLLSAMLDLNPNRLLASGDDLSLSLHLHDPNLYRDDHGQGWLDVARRDSRLSLSLDVQNPQEYTPMREGGQVGEVMFRFSEALAPRVIADWGLPASVADLTELPTGTALARLPGMVVTLKASEE